jgi:hypothetical protein
VHLTPQDLAEWSRAEEEWFADRDARVERLALAEVVRRIHESRLRDARRADGELSRAIAKADAARKLLDQATRLLEDAAKLSTLGRT